MRSAVLSLLAVLIMSAAAPANAEITNPTGVAVIIGNSADSGRPLTLNQQVRGSNPLDGTIISPHVSFVSLVVGISPLGGCLPVSALCQQYSWVWSLLNSS